MKTDRIRTDITDITFVFIFLSGFGFEYALLQDGLVVPGGNGL